MTCIKTGADVMVGEHGALVHGDLFRVGNVYILSCSDRVEECASLVARPWATPNITFHSWEQVGSRTLAARADVCSEFNYDGQPLVTTKED